MKKIILLAAVIILPMLSVQADQVSDKVSYVNPMIGTEGMGHTFPGACAPFGIVQLSPDTDTIPHNIDGVYQGKVYEYCAGGRWGGSTDWGECPGEDLCVELWERQEDTEGWLRL